MIIYSPLDGDAFTTAVSSNVRHCFLMTRLGKPVKRAFLITGNKALRKKAQVFARNAGLESRAKNSVEVLAAAF